jgi:hypothetical protein
MSLTSHLNDSHSPIYGFMRERFPNTRGFVRAANKGMKGAATIRPEEQVDWGTIGTAIDYRLRYYFGVTSPERLIAWQGAAQLKLGHVSERAFWVATPNEIDLMFERMDLVSRTIDEFFRALGGFVGRVRPARRRLPKEEEERLCRYCVVLACLEQVFRAGALPGNPLFAEARGTVPELLHTADQAVVDDLCSLSWAFYKDHEGLLHRTAVLNPTFDGSMDVGGADADLIVDGCLLDIKARVGPRLLQGDDLYQLLGYVLLDYPDRYGIGEAGVYFARQRRMLRWPLEDLIGGLSEGATLPLHELRDQFRSVVQGS